MVDETKHEIFLELLSMFQLVRMYVCMYVWLSTRQKAKMYGSIKKLVSRSHSVFKELSKKRTLNCYRMIYQK